MSAPTSEAIGEREATTPLAPNTASGLAPNAQPDAKTASKAPARFDNQPTQGGQTTARAHRVHLQFPKDVPADGG